MVYVLVENEYIKFSENEKNKKDEQSEKNSHQHSNSVVNKTRFLANTIYIIHLCSNAKCQSSSTPSNMKNSERR